MSIKNIKNKLRANSKQDSTWLKNAKWRKENEAWLDISFKIAVKVLSALKANKATGEYPKNQKELAMALDCSPQYISKLLKGKERLGIDTITKVGDVLGLQLITVPEEKVFNENLMSSDDKFILDINIEKMESFDHHFTTIWQNEFWQRYNYSANVQEPTYVRPNLELLKIA